LKNFEIFEIENLKVGETNIEDKNSRTSMRKIKVFGSRKIS